MLKKIISVSLIIVLMLSLMLLVPASPATATAVEAENRTVESILDEYYDRSFASAVSGVSLCSSGETLEEETIRALNDAGYEAYHITADNYDTLEAQLATSFSSMGLSRDSSYILTFGNERSVTDPFPKYDNIEEPGQASEFWYEYNGSSFKMRFATIAPTATDGMVVTSAYALSKNDLVKHAIQTLLEGMLVAVADGIFESAHIGTIGSLLLSRPSDGTYVELIPDSLVVHAQSFWTIQFIQVWDVNSSRWDSPYLSEYVTSNAKCAGWVYDADTNESVWCEGPWQKAKIYSSQYHDLETRKVNAMHAYDLGQIQGDCVYEVAFYVKNKNVTISANTAGKKMFTHKRSFSTVTPPID